MTQNQISFCQNSHLFQINVSQGGVPKTPVREALLTVNGLTADKQKHLKFHGGVMRAVCLYSLEHIIALQREGHPIYPGSTGENLTVANLDWTKIDIGAQLKIGGEVIIEITSYTVPCKQIAASFLGGAFNRISQKHRPGWSRLYARVICEGTLIVGQTVEINPCTKSDNEVAS